MTKKLIALACLMLVVMSVIECFSQLYGLEIGQDLNKSSAITCGPCYYRVGLEYDLEKVTKLGMSISLFMNLPEQLNIFWDKHKQWRLSELSKIPVHKKGRMSYCLSDLANIDLVIFKDFAKERNAGQSVASFREAEGYQIILSPKKQALELGISGKKLSKKVRDFIVKQKEWKLSELTKLPVHKDGKTVYCLCDLAEIDIKMIDGRKKNEKRNERKKGTERKERYER